MGSGSMVCSVQGTIIKVWVFGAHSTKVWSIGAPTGTEVFADSGMVTSAGWNVGLWELRQDRSRRRKSDLVQHLSKMAVATGATVEKGQVIGYVGSTESPQAPTLHFEVHVDGGP